MFAENRAKWVNITPRTNKPLWFTDVYEQRMENCACSCAHFSIHGICEFGQLPKVLSQVLGVHAKMELLTLNRKSLQGIQIWQWIWHHANCRETFSVSPAALSAKAWRSKPPKANFVLCRYQPGHPSFKFNIHMCTAPQRQKRLFQNVLNH